MSDEKTYRAAMIVIGNEILSGRTQDENTQYVGQSLTDKGISLSDVRVVPDVEQEIIDAVQALSAKYDYVFTSGGIGPTHDDITAPTIAKVFNVPVEENAEAYDILSAYYGEGELTDARRRMAQIPKGATLIENPVSAAPGFQIENVYVMAGVPKIMRAMVDNVVGTLVGGPPILSRTIPCSLYESELAVGLAEIQDRYPDIDIGSYPNYNQGQANVNVVLRGTDKVLLGCTAADVSEMLENLNGAPGGT